MNNKTTESCNNLVGEASHSDRAVNEFIYKLENQFRRSKRIKSSCQACREKYFCGALIQVCVARSFQAFQKIPVKFPNEPR